MTYEDAIEILSKHTVDMGKKSKRYAEAIKMAIVALEKQIHIEKELFHWEDWILAESPTGYHDVKEFSADDMQRMICRTIRECKEAIEKQIGSDEDV